MKETQIATIFPTSIYISYLNRDFLKKEINFVNKSKSKTYKNIGNITSNDTYILNNINFKNLKKEIEEKLNDYFVKIISTENKITPYITQSWLNYTTKNQHHHIHAHPNSFISGVLYINADKQYDKIYFYKKDSHNTISPFINNKNLHLLNSNVWWIPVETGQIVLFPSCLTHSVETKKEDDTRISLAFNTFVKGTLGSEKELTQLIL